MEHSWEPSKYVEFVEKTPCPSIQDYMKVEFSIISKVENPKEKTFIEVGAGPGRVIPQLSKIAKQVIAVEIDKKMLNELKKQENQYPNIAVIDGDAQNLSELLKDFNIKKPVVLSLQNTLGTPTGDPFKILSEMIKLAKNNNGEIIISLLIQEGLKDYGMQFYVNAQEMVGEVDLEKTDFQKGIFISKTGYRSHWWRPEERTELANIVGGTKIAEITGKCFYILHSKY